MVFDLDGTLIDSARDLAESASELVQGYGAAPLTIADVTAMVGEGAAVLVRKALEKSGLDPHTPGALDRFLAIYDRRLVEHTSPYPGLVESLSLAVRRGPMAVLTNKPAAPSRQILDALGLSGFFPRIVGGDGPFPRKPDPSGLLALAGEAHMPAVMIGDSPADWRTAHAALCPFVFARYGFGAAQFGGAPPGTAYAIEHARELDEVLTRVSADLDLC
jgi:phosphoglycolate phosphatase